MKKTIAVIVFFVAAILAGVFLRYAVAPAAPAKTEDVADGKEHFMQKQVGMPLDQQAVTGAAGVSGYQGTPPLLGSEPKPLSEKPYDMANDQELYMFESNKVGADCCPSPFSGDLGCICLTDKQRAEFASRGGNRSVKENT
jgi:hypothetical protein